MNRDGSFPMTYSMNAKSISSTTLSGKRPGWDPPVLCIGYLERRVGRKLMARDYPDHPLNETPGTQ